MKRVCIWFFSMRCYGYLFGRYKLIKDTHHDEVFIEANGLVVVRNNVWQHSYKELIAIAREELDYD